MIGAQIRTMLEAEIKASDEFTQRNFGLATGEEFREIVEETVKSRKVASLLMLDILMVATAGNNLAEWMKENEKTGMSAIDQMAGAILNNFAAFKGPMDFLYWGIQIGRKLERQEAETLKSLEREQNQGLDVKE